MPNYSLDTTGAVFQPFSFKELIEPYEMMRVAEEKLQNDYITLSDNIGQWQGAVASSPTLSAQLQKYQDDVMAATQELQETGRLDRSKFVNLRKRMMSEISPIKTAVDNYNKALDLDTKMRSADGTYIAKRQVPTLEDFANGETRYSGGISGNTVFQRASAAGKELSKDKKAILDDYIGDEAFVKIAQESGIPAEQLALQAIKAGNAPKEVIDIYNSLRDSIGYGEYDQTGRDMIDANIHLGLLSASKERTEALQRNPHDEWVPSYQKEKDYAEINAKTRLLGYEYIEDNKGKMTIRQLTPEEHKAAIKGYNATHSKSGTPLTLETTEGGYPKVSGDTKEERQEDRKKILSTMGLRVGKNDVNSLPVIKAILEDDNLKSFKKKLIEEKYYDDKEKKFVDNIEVRKDGGKNRYTIVYKDNSDYNGYLKIATIDAHTNNGKTIYDNFTPIWEGDMGEHSNSEGSDFYTDNAKQGASEEIPLQEEKVDSVLDTPWSMSNQTKKYTFKVPFKQ